MATKENEKGYECSDHNVAPEMRVELREGEIPRQKADAAEAPFIAAAGIAKNIV